MLKLKLPTFSCYQSYQFNSVTLHFKSAFSVYLLWNAFRQTAVDYGL